MKQKPMTKQQLIQNLKGVNEDKTNGKQDISIYPCSSCDCGSVMVRIGFHDDDVPVINVDINDPNGLKAATAGWNYVNNYQVNMTEMNFLNLLNHMFKKD